MDNIVCRKDSGGNVPVKRKFSQTRKVYRVNRSNFAFTFILSLLLFVIVLFQLNAVRRTARFEKRLVELTEKLADSDISNKNIQAVIRAEEADTENFYPGDNGDWRIWGFRAEPRSLNPLSSERDTYTTWITQGTVFESLLVYDFETLDLKPHLAESYDVSDDGLEISFTLRNDIHFSDGAGITTDDVIFTYETLINPEIDAADLAGLFADVKEVVKVNDRTVKFVMKQAHFKSLENLSFWNTGIFPKHVYQFDDPAELNDQVSNPVGSGPYLFENWDIGYEIVLRRNENYWGPKPKLEKIIYRFITNETALVQALRAGEIDMMRPSGEQFAALISEEGFTDDFKCLSYWNPPVPFYYIAWNMDRPFFADRRVRLAMTRIIDRDLIVSSLLKGNGKVITGPFYIKSKACDHSIRPWPYDLQKARRLLDDAGWVDSDGDGLRDKDGVTFSFRFTIPGSDVLSERIAKLVKDSAAKVGIEVIVDPLEWSILMDKVNNRMFDAVTMGTSGGILHDPYKLWHSSQIGNRGANFSGFSNPEADRIIQDARRTFDKEKRMSLYRRLHGILHVEQPFTFLYSRPTFRIIHDRFENVRIYPLGLNYSEWYVPINQQKYGLNRYKN